MTGCEALVRMDRNRLKPCRTSMLVAKMGCRKNGEITDMMRLRLFTVHEMTLTPRQATAEKLKHWLQAMGAFVTNPMPLDPQKSLRFDVLNNDRERVLAELHKQDWAPTTGVVHMRFYRDQLVPCTSFEITLPADQPVTQDRRIYGDCRRSGKEGGREGCDRGMVPIYFRRKEEMTPQALTEIQKLRRYMPLLEEKVCQLANVKDLLRWRAEMKEIARGLGAYWGDFDEVPPGAERSSDENTQSKS